MDALFSRMLEENTTKVNPLIMNGLACTYVKHAEAYLDKVMQSAAKSFPPGLVYLGYERCTYLEEYLEATKVKNNKRAFDLARSDIYMVKYKFSYLGEELKDRYIYLPFVGDAGIFSLSDSRFHITPVLSDKVVSLGSNTIFVRLLRDKIIFKRCYHSLIIDGTRETCNVIWSQIYRKRETLTRQVVTTKAVTALAHYLFCRYGFDEAFRKYTGVVPITGTTNINEENYPKDKWVICSSTNVKPKTFIHELYTHTDIKLAIPRDQFTDDVKSFVVGFYYVVDHFPTRFKAAPEYLNNTQLWKILLGHIIFSGIYGEGKLFNDIEEHFVSLNDYLDNIVLEKLHEDNYDVHDFYDLIALLLLQFNNLILDKNIAYNSLYGKSLEVLYYVLFDITAAIFRVNFKLNKLAGKKTLTAKDITETFNKGLKIGLIFRLRSGKIIASSVNYSGDNMYFKITSKINEQETNPGNARGASKRITRGTDKHIDMSQVEVGSMLFLSKSDPNPTGHINPFMHFDPNNGSIIRNPELIEALDELQSKLTYTSNLIGVDVEDSELDVEKD